MVQVINVGVLIPEWAPGVTAAVGYGLHFMIYCSTILQMQVLFHNFEF